ncbi:hypothetical protein AOQ84DRAFT_371141 [Glonium stellatum]|uniref:Uncharacterized protein n=1 Tax=Glonium stellatum TaxID=574774 RepID=A0A8E2FCF8_9PEZI|nr:hypothetical protein AOQ84DRAFT_371141 [Glonium stellatum]
MATHWNAKGDQHFDNREVTAAAWDIVDGCVRLHNYGSDPEERLLKCNRNRKVNLKKAETVREGKEARVRELLQAKRSGTPVPYSGKYQQPPEVPPARMSQAQLEVGAAQSTGNTPSYLSPPITELHSLQVAPVYQPRGRGFTNRQARYFEGISRSVEINTLQPDSTFVNTLGSPVVDQVTLATSKVVRP